MTNVGSKAIKNFSLGMWQRLGIARAIMTRPELLILDEPTNGMDPVGIHELRDLFRSLSKEYGITLLISSHILQEIEHLADTIGVIHQGRLIEEVSIESVRGQHSEFIEMVTTSSEQAAAVLEDKLKFYNYKVLGNETIRVYDPDFSPVELSRALIRHDVGVTAPNKKTASLEEHFLRLIQGEIWRRRT
ncbi:ATP-binding cassette domain-containing protein [Cohnella nanjingensis]|uniref:ATP-binding cassette domain-containing protein n=1 Tax=Cohnella nanjingensis TaxID=1387779 RepID=A0A7X0RWY7_9BACL|nr:ATP-binding cassette domain-containing protein [Cohnella nanjingensis]